MKVDSVLVFMILMSIGSLTLSVWRFITHGFGVGFILLLIFFGQLWNISYYIQRKQEAEKFKRDINNRFQRW